MPKIEEKLSDTIDDRIGQFLSNFRAYISDSSDKERWAMRKNLRALLKNDGYISFESYSSTYNLSKVGDSCIYNISNKHKGKLKPFAGQRVRVVCIGSDSHWKRKFAASPIEPLETVN